MNLEYTVTSKTRNATIRYTTDDTPVTESSEIYESPVIGNFESFRTKTFKPGYNPSKEKIFYPRPEYWEPTIFGEYNERYQSTYPLDPDIFSIENGTIMLCGYNYFYISKDQGITWDYKSDVTWGNYMYSGNNTFVTTISTTSGPGLRKTTDGEVIERINLYDLGLKGYCYNVFYNEGVWTLATTSKFYAYSTDLINFEIKDLSSNPSFTSATSFRENFYLGGKYFVVTNEGIYYSDSSLETWTKVDNCNFTSNYNNPVKLNGKLAFRKDKTLYTTTDGLTWEEINLPLSGTGANVSYGNGIYLIGGYDDYQEYFIYSTTDFSSYKEIYHSYCNRDELVYITFLNNGRFYSKNKYGVIANSIWNKTDFIESFDRLPTPQLSQNGNYLIITNKEEYTEGTTFKVWVTSSGFSIYDDENSDVDKPTATYDLNNINYIDITQLYNEDYSSFYIYAMASKEGINDSLMSREFRARNFSRIKSNTPTVTYNPYFNILKMEVTDSGSVDWVHWEIKFEEYNRTFNVESNSTTAYFKIPEEITVLDSIEVTAQVEHKDTSNTTSLFGIKYVKPLSYLSYNIINNSIVLSHLDSTAKIYYKTSEEASEDFTNLDELLSYHEYTSPISFTKDTSIYAYAMIENKAVSEVIKIDAKYNSISQCSSVIIHFKDNEITLTCPTLNSKIYYTLNGSTPNESSNLYSSPIFISEDCTVKAIAISSGYNNSLESSLDCEYDSYIIAPIRDIPNYFDESFSSVYSAGYWTNAGMYITVPDTRNNWVENRDWSNSPWNSGYRRDFNDKANILHVSSNQFTEEGILDTWDEEAPWTVGTKQSYIKGYADGDYYVWEKNIVFANLGTIAFNKISNHKLYVGIIAGGGWGYNASVEEPQIIGFTNQYHEVRPILDAEYVGEDYMKVYGQLTVFAHQGEAYYPLTSDSKIASNRRFSTIIDADEPFYQGVAGVWIVRDENENPNFGLAGSSNCYRYLVIVDIDENKDLFDSLGLTTDELIKKYLDNLPQENFVPAEIPVTEAPSGSMLPLVNFDKNWEDNLNIKYQVKNPASFNDYKARSSSNIVYNILNDETVYQEISDETATVSALQITDPFMSASDKSGYYVTSPLSEGPYRYIPAPIITATRNGSTITAVVSNMFESVTYRWRYKGPVNSATAGNALEGNTITFDDDTSGYLYVSGFLEGYGSSQDSVNVPANTPTTSIPIISYDSSSKTVTITCNTENSSIVYKIGSDGRYQPYSTSFVLDKSSVIYAFGKSEELGDSNIAYTYCEV